MNIYSFFTESHRILKDDWFLPSLPEGCEPIIDEFPEPPSKLCIYGSRGFNELMRSKVSLILRAISENEGRVFGYMDIDVQFFRPFVQLIEPLMKDSDLLFQQDSPEGLLCAGVFVARANDAVRGFWEKTLELCKKDPSVDDQDVANRLLFNYGTLTAAAKFSYRLANLFRQGPAVRRSYSTFRGLRWSYLPCQFFSGGTFTGKQWTLGQTLPVPSNPVLHHANWTTGVENKVQQLALVKRKVVGQRSF